jgi:aminopeptidase N
LNDSSYSVSGEALDGLGKLEPAQAYNLAKKYSKDARGKLGSVVTQTLMANGTEDDFNTLLENYKNSPLSQAKIQETIAFGNYLAKVKNSDNVRKGTDAIMSVRNQVPERFRNFVDPGIKQTFSKISTAKRSEGNTQLADYIDGLLK